jgi:hypothetical protein
VVHSDCRAGVVALESCLELPEIAGEPGRIEPEVVAGAQHRVVIQRGTQEVERVTEAVAGVAAVALGPEQGHHAVAGQRARVLYREQSQQRNALAQRRPAGHGAIRAIEDSGAEQSKCECHKNLRATTRAGYQRDGRL